MFLLCVSDLPIYFVGRQADQLIIYILKRFTTVCAHYDVWQRIKSGLLMVDGVNTESGDTPLLLAMTIPFVDGKPLLRPRGLLQSPNKMKLAIDYIYKLRMHTLLEQLLRPIVGNTYSSSLSG